MTKISSLSLTRRPGACVTIFTSDGPIEVKFARHKGGGILLNFTAPSHIPIIRSELLTNDDEDFNEPCPNPSTSGESPSITTPSMSTRGPLAGHFPKPAAASSA